MSEVNQETLERLVTTTEQLLAALPVLANAPSGEPSESLINYSEVVGYGDASDPAINHLPEIISYEQVYQIKTNDYLVGGANGIANLQARALVGRDNFLRKMIEALTEKVNAIDISAGTDDTKYTELIQRLDSLDVNVFEKQILQLERQNMVNALTMKSAGLTVDEYGLILEVFQDYYVSQVDQTNAEVVSVIMGDDSVDIADAKNLIKGGIYQLTDGELSEEVQIKDNLGAIVNGYRILFTNDVVNSYKNGRARLYRSSAKVAEGKAYGGGISRTKTWSAGIDFAGASEESEIVATLDFSNGLGFDLTNANVDSEGHIVLGEEPIGVALTTNGWARIDAEGDDLNA